GRPSTLVVLRQVDPRAVGALLALYEHKAFVQAALWRAGRRGRGGRPHGIAGPKPCWRIGRRAQTTASGYS
ncbi:hypothetical protein, partial [Bordetella pertussis]|uniref:hypothetical protein n=1 Tax=Bordetella pertussis TaxID=520 RepID=UPI0021CBA87D